MSDTIEIDQKLKEDALAILSQHLPPHKVARLISTWQIGKGDYVKDRAALPPHFPIALQATAR